MDRVNRCDMGRWCKRFWLSNNHESVTVRRVIKMKYAIAWFVLACLLGIFLSQLNWVAYLKLMRRGLRTEGTVIQAIPEMHGTVRYSYEAGGRKYEGQTQPTMPNPPIDRLKPGAVVTIYYDPQTPEKSVLGNPNLLFRNETITIVLVVLLLPTAL